MNDAAGCPKRSRPWVLAATILGIISAAFPEKERGRAIGTWAGASALTTALGPVLGGWLADAWSWRAIFFINVPIAALALAITVWHTPESHDRNAGQHLDWSGAVLAVGGVGGPTVGVSVA